MSGIRRAQRADDLDLSCPCLPKELYEPGEPSVSDQPLCNTVFRRALADPPPDSVTVIAELLFPDPLGEGKGGVDAVRPYIGPAHALRR